MEMGTRAPRCWPLIGAVLLVLALPTAAPGAGPRACSVDRVEGESARHWHAGVWSEVVAGLSLATDDKIATGTDSRVRIVCDNGIVLTVGVETKLNLESLVGIEPARKPVVIQLLDGIAGLVLPQPFPDGFEARTPVLTAGVRGTEWLVEWQPGDSAAVFVRRGRVEVRSVAGGRFVLGDGDGVTVSAAGVAGAVSQWGAPRIAGAGERLGFDWR